MSQPNHPLTLPAHRIYVAPKVLLYQRARNSYILPATAVSQREARAGQDVENLRAFFCGLSFFRVFGPFATAFILLF